MVSTEKPTKHTEDTGEGGIFGSNILAVTSSFEKVSRWTLILFEVIYPNLPCIWKIYGYHFTQWFVLLCNNSCKITQSIATNENMKSFSFWENHEKVNSTKSVSFCYDYKILFFARTEKFQTFMETPYKSFIPFIFGEKEGWPKYALQLYKLLALFCYFGGYFQSFKNYSND